MWFGLGSSRVFIYAHIQAKNMLVILCVYEIVHKHVELSSNRLT